MQLEEWAWGWMAEEGGESTLGHTEAEITVMHVSGCVHQTEGLKLQGDVGKDTQHE